MSKLPRITQKIFGSGAGSNQLAQIGSLAAGSPVFTTNPAVMQALSNYLNGWFDCVINGASPAIEDMNSIHNLTTQQLAYLFQSGIPEYDPATTYYTNSFVTYLGAIYFSLIDNNLNNTPNTSPGDWEVYSINASYFPNGSVLSGEYRMPVFVGGSAASLSGATTIDGDLFINGTIALGGNNLTVAGDFFGMTSGSGTVTVRGIQFRGNLRSIWPTVQGSPNTFLQNSDGSGTLVWATAGSGNVVGPGSAESNAIAVFADTSGKLLENTPIVVDLVNGGFVVPIGGYIGNPGGNDQIFFTAGHIQQFYSNGAATFQNQPQGFTTGPTYPVRYRGTNHVVSVQANAPASDYSITWPDAPGGSGTVLTNDGTGQLFWIVPSGGGIGTLLPNGSTLSGTYNGDVVVSGSATVIGNVVINGNLLTLADLNKTDGSAFTVNGNAIVLGGIHFTPGSTSVVQQNVLITGDFVLGAASDFKVNPGSTPNVTIYGTMSGTWNGPITFDGSGLTGATAGLTVNVAGTCYLVDFVGTGPDADATHDAGNGGSVNAAGFSWCSFSCDGGSTAVAGKNPGNGGTVSAYSGPFFIDNDSSVKGGANTVSGGTGGNGGQLNVTGDLSVVKATAAFDLSGGDGDGQGGTGGSTGPTGLIVSGFVLRLNGGNSASGTGGSAGTWGGGASNASCNDGTIEAKGGNGATGGGAGLTGLILSTCAGNVDVSGGTGGTGTGGQGGTVTASGVVSGSINVLGGTGGVAGATGSVTGPSSYSGKVTLAGGSATVMNAVVGPSSVFQLTYASNPASGGFLYVDPSNTVAGTSFVIDSSNNADVADVYWTVTKAG